MNKAASRKSDQKADRPVSDVEESGEKIQMSFRLSRQQWQRIRTLAIDERVTSQAVILAALGDYFTKKGLKF